MSKSPLEQFVLPERLNRLDSVLQHRTRNLCVVLDRVHNPHNISAVIRSCDAFGIQDVHFVGDNFNSSSGISLGTERWLTFYEHKSSEEAATHLSNQGYELVMLEAESKQPAYENVKMLPVFDLPFEKKLALVFGNEHSGVTEELRKIASYHAYIPMFGFVESLNISVAAAITIFCSLLSEAKLNRKLPPLSENEQIEIKKEWVKTVGSSRVDLQACKLEYSIVSPK